MSLLCSGAGISGTQPLSCYSRHSAADANGRCNVTKLAALRRTMPDKSCISFTSPSLRNTGTRTRATSDAGSLEVSSNGEASKNSRRLAVLRANKTAFQPVEELRKSLAEYMTLPASQYSVLDAKRIERVNETTFLCFVGGLNFLNIQVEPVLTVSVDVGERGPTVRLLSTKLQGSDFVQAANNKFDATMTNTVRWREAVTGSGKEITSETSIQVVLEVPRWFAIVPIPAIESSGSTVLQGVLNTMVPRFLQQLSKDYKAWASGDQSRMPVGNGEL